MNKTLKKIIELSDCEWIQERWKPKKGEYAIWYDKRFKDIRQEIMTIESIITISEFRKEFIWLPVGFNHKTGREQIDELLWERIGGNCDFSRAFLYEALEEWRRLELREYANTMIILKLTWLRELRELMDEEV